VRGIGGDGHDENGMGVVFVCVKEEEEAGRMGLSIETGIRRKVKKV
jgi:hypothetical protein